MNDPQLRSIRRDEKEGQQAINSEAGVRCPVFIGRDGVNQLTTDFSEEHLGEAGCPVAPAMQNLGRFESVLTELSATFVNIPADQVDSQIESALRKLVELLGVDRVALGQVKPDGSAFIVTHSSQLPGIPSAVQMILTSQFPTYAKMLRQGKVLRLPEDLPDEATQLG